MKNQVFLVLDSLRWDLFTKANTPFLKSLGPWKKAYTQGTYTLPAHMSFFMGKLPQTLDGTDYYDAGTIRYNRDGKRVRSLQLWGLLNPEAPRRARYDLEGDNVIRGFAAKGYYTLGTGAVNWFNPDVPAGRYLTDPFEECRFFGGPHAASHESAEDQIAWALDRLGRKQSPYFLFINFGETHSRFVYRGCSWHDEPNPQGHARRCRERQRKCLEYLDIQIAALLEQLQGYDLVICSDHGEVMGEDGLWGHGFHHRRIAEVPMLIKLDERA